MTVFFIALAFYIGFGAFIYLFQRSLMYHPSSGFLDPGQFGVPEMEVVKVETDDGLSLTAWYRPPAHEDALTILYLHGNAGHIGYRASKVKPYLDAGYGVLLLSYRGYGTNHGYPTEKNLYLDGKAALDFLADQKIPIFKTVLYGESLGTGVAVEIAQNKAIFALVLEAPFSSMVDAAQYHFKLYPASILVRDKYDSLNKINKIKAPLIILHGVRDRTVPYKLGRKLFDAAANPKEFLKFKDVGHNNLYDFHAADRIMVSLDSQS